VAKLGDLTGGGTFTEHLLDGITRNDMDQEKNEREHQPQGRESQQKAIEEVARHFVAELTLLSG
jgi:hypothetical protein